jgi:hypothetical protein
MTEMHCLGLNNAIMINKIIVLILFSAFCSCRHKEQIDMGTETNDFYAPYVEKTDGYVREDFDSLHSILPPTMPVPIKQSYRNNYSAPAFNPKNKYEIAFFQNNEYAVSGAPNGLYKFNFLTGKKTLILNNYFISFD